MLLGLQPFMPDARAYWVTSDLIAWNVGDQEAASVCLYASRAAAMHLSPSPNGGIQGTYAGQVHGWMPEPDGCY